MTKFFLLFFIISQTISFSQDSRRFNHGACIVGYQNEDDTTKYYLTWSSAFENEWEHDIYTAGIFFNGSGDLIIDKADELYIGTGADEAQEPVNTVINKVNNTILSVWEDGNDLDAPNVRGQLHNPDGSILRENWIIAGGFGSQHSANTAHLGNKYLIFYADEAPPSDGGAVLKVKVIDDVTGNETQALSFTPNDQDHWWPVSVSNTNNTRTLIIWGNDGYATRGTVLYENDETIELTGEPQNYLENTQHYFYQVEWLENISQFLLIARNGAFEEITDSSQICLIDTLGNLTYSTTVAGGILREAKMAVKWIDCNETYGVFFPTGEYDLTQVSISNSNIISSVSNRIENVTETVTTIWESTGIWSTFIEDINGNDLFDDHYIALFLMNDVVSNDKVLIQVEIDTTLFCAPLEVPEFHIYTQNLMLYPNPSTGLIRMPDEFINFSYQIASENGRIVKTGTINATYLDISSLDRGFYLISIFENKTRKKSVFKILKE